MSLEGPLQLLALLPLSLAAGVDLYLTLLFLALATRLGWETPPPGELAELAVPAVAIAAALLWIAERLAERATLSALVWNSFHTVIRPLAGALLALMALADLPPTTRWTGALAAAALTAAAHVTRSGWTVLLSLIRAPGRLRLLVSAAEDAGALALLSLLLDAPWAAVALAAFIAAAGVRWGAAAASAFIFVSRLLRDAIRTFLRPRRWRPPERFPPWIHRVLAEPAEPLTGAVRGTPAGAINLPGTGLFRRGWVIVRSGAPFFLYRWQRRAHRVDLASYRALSITPGSLHTYVELSQPEGGSFALYVSVDGPPPEDLEAQFRPVSTT